MTIWVLHIAAGTLSRGRTGLPRARVARRARSHSAGLSSQVGLPCVAWELKETWGFPKHPDLLGACRAAYARHHTGMSALREVRSGPLCTRGWQSHPRPALRVSHASEVTAQRTVGTNRQLTGARGLGELPGGRGALYPPQPHQG